MHYRFFTFWPYGDDLLQTQIYHPAKFHRHIRYKISADEQTKLQTVNDISPACLSPCGDKNNKEWKTNTRTVPQTRKEKYESGGESTEQRNDVADVGYTECNQQRDNEPHRHDTVTIDAFLARWQLTGLVIRTLPNNLLDAADNVNKCRPVRVTYDHRHHHHHHFYCRQQPSIFRLPNDSQRPHILMLCFLFAV